MLFALLGLGMLMAPAQAEVLRVGLAMPQGMQEVAYLNGMFERFKQEVESSSDGALKVQLYYGGVLGKPDDRLNQMRRNVIQMSDASEGNYATIYRDIQVFSIPYLFQDRDVALAVLDGPVGEQVAEGLRIKSGIRVLGWWESAGFKHYSANAPLRDLADFRGRKFRVMSAVFSIPVTAMGGIAISLPMNELYLSLKTGVVDGQNNAVAVFNMQKLHEVQSHISLDAHAYSFGPLGINDSFFRSLSEEKKRIVLAAAQRAIAWNRRMSRQMDEAAIALARSKGVRFIELSEQQRARFAETAQPATIEWLRGNIDHPSLIEAVLEETARIAGRPD